MTTYTTNETKLQMSAKRYIALNRNIVSAKPKRTKYNVIVSFKGQDAEDVVLFLKELRKRNLRLSAGFMRNAILDAIRSC